MNLMVEKYFTFLRSAQKHYHEHFEQFHPEVIENRKKAVEKRHGETKVSSRPNEKKNVNKKIKEHRNSCSLCPDRPPFRYACDREKHLVDHHAYDICNQCKLIGKMLTM